MTRRCKLPLTVAASTRTGLSSGETGEGIVDEVGDGALEQGRVDVDPRKRFRNVDLDSIRGTWRPTIAAATISSMPIDWASDRDAAGLQPAHVEQVADERVQPLGFIVDRLSSSCCPRRSQSISSLSRLVAEALIDASGVRKSWLTRGKKRGAELVRLRPARWRWPLRPATAGPARRKASWVAKPLSTSRSAPGSSVPDNARIEPSAKANDRPPTRRSCGGFRPAAARCASGRRHRRRRRRPRDGTLRSSSASCGSGSASAGRAGQAANAALRPALGRRRPSRVAAIDAGRSTTPRRRQEAMSASTFSRSAMVNVWIGGVKYQFGNRKAPRGRVAGRRRRWSRSRRRQE